ncbi:hypothetical protein [Methylobacterium nodulans]|uniref:hypothetical protein n=1 Tax=Methylobacterium nodulans TaxID=114616 RepID=UPI0012ECE80D|nr:hypothetical protein [Methylobacterium nodulans]
MAGLYGSATGLKRTTVSWRLFQDTNKLDVIASGRDLYLGRYERAMQFFSDHWPDNLPWPDDIRRPPKSAAQVEAALAASSAASMAEAAP